MNHLTERAFKAWLEAEGVLVPVYTGLTGEKIPKDSQVISCYAGDSEHRVGALHTVDVQVILATPPHTDSGNDEAVSLTAHKDVLNTIRGLVKDFDADASQLETTFNTTTGSTLSGGFFKGETEDTMDGRWISTLTLMIGVKEAA